MNLIVTEHDETCIRVSAAIAAYVNSVTMIQVKIVDAKMSTIDPTVAENALTEIRGCEHVMFLVDKPSVDDLGPEMNLLWATAKAHHKRIFTTTLDALTCAEREVEA